MGLNGDTSPNNNENHITLLRNEYSKLQSEHVQLQRQYSELVAARGATNDDDTSFISRLVATAGSLYGRTNYSDIVIKLKNRTFPGHKIILNSRSDLWSDKVLTNATELDWSELDEDVGEILLNWIYKDIADLQSDELSLRLIRAAHQFSLSGLIVLCERHLIASAGVHSCVRYYCVAEEVGAKNLLEYCSGLISTYWDELTPQDFEHMSAPLLYKMLKCKTSYPLHTAVRLEREDVVFLCIVENNNCLKELVNSFSHQGLLPLHLALTAKNRSIATLLVKDGMADVDAYTNEGTTLLIDAVKNGQEFAANFLLERKCDVNLTARSTGDTALHVICSYTPDNVSEDTFKSIIEIGKKVLALQSNVNLQNFLGQTPLHIAIGAHNNEMINQLITLPNINVTMLTKGGKCALELSLLGISKEASEDAFDLPRKLLHLGANPKRIKTENNNTLLESFISLSLEDQACFLAEHSDFSHFNAVGYTALHLAAKENFAKLVHKLLELDDTPNRQTNVSELKSPLHVAVEAKALDAIMAFVEFNKVHKTKIDFNAKDINGNSPLSLCLTHHYAEPMPHLISAGADINLRNEQDLTLLHQAIIESDAKSAIFLLEQGADMNAVTKDGETPLTLAIKQRLLDVVDFLCTQGVLLSAPNGKGDPPLWTALELGNEDIAHILVRHGVDTDCWDIGPDGCRQTLLHRAIDENKEDAAIFLIRSQCDLDSPRQPGPNGEGSNEVKDKSTPLHLCCQWDLIKVLQTLIDHGANVNAVDAEKKTPLHVAIESHHKEIISILLFHPNIDLKIRDSSGNTAFASALNLRNHKAAESILERFPNAAEQVDQRGRNFLHVAISKDDLESVLFLLAIQVDVNSRVHDASQSTALHLAASSKNEMIIRNLLLAGAGINEKDANQKTPLHVACEQGNVLAVTALIQNNVDCDAIDADGNNALHIAVRGSHLSVVRELLTESRVNAELINTKGRNPLHELCRFGEDNTAATICELFIECMPEYPINKPDLNGNTPLLLAFMRGQAGICRVLVKSGACLGAENREGVSIFNFKLATDQLLCSLLDQLPQESPWAESDLCQECGTKFTFTMRKHHCRHCGRMLCSKCSSYDVPILKFGINKPVRVCCVCFAVLQGESDIRAFH